MQVQRASLTGWTAVFNAGYNLASDANNMNETNCRGNGEWYYFGWRAHNLIPYSPLDISRPWQVNQSHIDD